MATNQTNVAILVILVKLIILSQAMVLAHLTFSAYRRSGEDDLRTLSLAFGSIFVGIVIGGLTLQVFSVSLLVGLLAESVFTALGLGIMIYSLYGYQ